MANTIKFIFKGQKELMNALESLEKKAGNSIMQKAVLEGLKVIRDEARNNATPGNILSPEATGTMKKAIKIRARVKDFTHIIGKIYISRKIQLIINGVRHIPGYIAHLVEFGHLGKKALPHPFLRPALDAKKELAFMRIASKARQLLNDLIRGKFS